MRTCVILHNMIVECHKEDYIRDGHGGLREDVARQEVVQVEWVAVDAQEGATGFRHGKLVKSEIEHDHLKKAVV